MWGRTYRCKRKERMGRESERKRTISLNRIWRLLSCNRQIIATGNRCCGVQGDKGGALSVVVAF